MSVNRNVTVPLGSSTTITQACRRPNENGSAGKAAGRTSTSTAVAWCCDEGTLAPSEPFNSPRTLRRWEKKGRSSFRGTRSEWAVSLSGLIEPCSCAGCAGLGMAHSAGPFSQEWADVQQRHGLPEDLLDSGICESCRLSAKGRQSLIWAGAVELWSGRCGSNGSRRRGTGCSRSCCLALRSASGASRARPWRVGD